MKLSEINWTKMLDFIFLSIWLIISWNNWRWSSVHSLSLKLDTEHFIGVECKKIFKGIADGKKFHFLLCQMNWDNIAVIATTLSF